MILAVLKTALNAQKHNNNEISLAISRSALQANFTRIPGYISTAQKRKVNILTALEDAFLGKPFNPSLKSSDQLLKKY